MCHYLHKLREFISDVSIFEKDYDVVVAGGGPAGFAAALSAARSGAKTLLVERYGYLGGMGSTGLPFLTFKDKTGQRVFGIADEFARRAIESGYTADDPSRDNWLAIDPEGVKLLFQEMLLEGGAHLLLHSWVEGVELSDGRIELLTTLGKGGRRAVMGEVFVDCTGDADLAALSGVPFQLGREDGKTMGMTLLFSLANVDVTEFSRALADGWKELVRRSGLRIPKEIKDSTFLNEDHFMPYMINPTRPGEVIFNWVQLILDRNPLDVEDLTSAEVEARRRIHLLFSEVIKPHIPGCKRSYIAQTACQMGVRESRRIRGRYTLTERDCREGRDFEDTVALCTYPFDLHASSRADEKNVILEAGMRDYVRIPYRIMVPSEGPANLLVAGRCVSADRMALSSIRVMVPCMSMGEAAGIAGAMAARDGIGVDRVDVGEVRSRLDLRE